MRSLFRNPDLMLLHGPSIYDFRTRPVLLGPVSDVVPSTPAFEMYPLGFANIVEALQGAGYSARILNVAFRMLQDPAFDAEAEIRKYEPRLFGIDLHWLVHAQGAVEVAKICKRTHPDIPVVFGGLSSTYYHEELIKRPEIDFILRGDSTEESVVRLVEAVRHGEGLDAVPGLTWTDHTGAVRVNPMTPPPAVLDHARDIYRALFRMVTRFLDAKNLTAIHDWWKHPQMAVLSFRGCKRNCAFCGGASSAFKEFYGRTETGYRPAERVAHDVYRLSRYTGAPIFLLGDPLEPGEAYAKTLFEAIGRMGVKNEMAVELYRPAPEWFYDLVAANVPAFNVEISPETHDESIRKTCGKGYPNQDLEDNIAWSLERGARRFDLFLMVGLPGQDRNSVLASIDWAGELMARFDSRLVPFTSALSPFLDPGSPIFENPGRYGYTVLRRSFEEHRAALEEASWEFILNYETDQLTRRDIVEVTYEAGRRLNRLKLEHGRVTRDQFDRVVKNADESEALATEIRTIYQTHPRADERHAALKALKPRLNALSSSIVCAKEEFRWPGGGFRYLNIARAVLTGG